MKRIKILTFNRAHNYGAILQAYALQEKIKSKNIDVEIIDYRNDVIEKAYRPLSLKEKSVKIIMKNIVKWILYHKRMIGRYKNFDNFIEKKLNLTSSVYNLEEVAKLDEKTDVFIVGSDQIWSKRIVGELSDVYTLNFRTDTLKISYAASVGDTTQIFKNAEEFKEKISKLDYISVREKDAKEELTKIITDKQIEVVVDPTLLLTREEWNKELSRRDNEKVVEEHYILAYVVSPDKEYIRIVNDLSEKTGLKVLHFGMKNPGYKNVLKSAYTEGPLEFINYIKNAEYVVATSFHATVFSIIFNKKFFIIPHKKTGSRVTNLLETLYIKNRTFNSLEEFKNIDYDFETDWESVNLKLEKERKKSLTWLENAINSRKGKENV